MYTRSLTHQNQSFFLIGPRGVGKSTWVKTHYPEAHRIDLLKTKEYLRLQQDPQTFRMEIEALKSNSWVFIDEIQKLPILLDEVHSLMTDRPGKYKFILTGSSARKLKREGANLLAGRALTNYLYPLTSWEIKDDFNLDQILRFGSLPNIVNTKDIKSKIRSLESYVETYLREEIQQEAVVKNLGAFSRFLKIAALSNAQKLNLSSVARNAGVERPTVQGYFQILLDTLLGDLVQPWPLKFRVKEVNHPKFYFFDTGVVRALLNLQYDSIETEERGFLLETLIYNELKAYNRYNDIGGEFYFWGTHSHLEVDFIFSRGRKAIGIEVKSAIHWRKEFSKSLKLLLDAKKISKAYGIYSGTKILKDDLITIFPINDFLEHLHQNKLELF